MSGAFDPRRRDNERDGLPVWDDWKRAEPGTRVRHLRTGATGTYNGIAGHRPRIQGARVTWDDVGFGPQSGVVVTPAYDLEPIP